MCTPVAGVRSKLLWVAHLPAVVGGVERRVVGGGGGVLGVVIARVGLALGGLQIDIGGWICM